jgi:hypothetical protein
VSEKKIQKRRVNGRLRRSRPFKKEVEKERHKENKKKNKEHKDKIKDWETTETKEIVMQDRIKTRNV